MTQALDLVDAMVAAADDKISDEDVEVIERSACPTCGSCSGMFTANSMNCLTEALGLALPGNGSTLATHADRKRLFVEAGHLIVDLAQPLLRAGRFQTCCRAAIASFKALRERHDARHRHGRLDQHRAASARRRPRGRGRLHHGGHRPPVAPGAGALQGRAVQSPMSTWRTSIAPAASWPSSASSTAPGCIDTEPAHCAFREPSASRTCALGHHARPTSQKVRDLLRRPPPAASRRRPPSARSRRFEELDTDREKGVIRSAEHAYLEGRRPRRALRQHRARRLHREDRRRRRLDPEVLRPGPHLRKPGCGGRGHPHQPASRPATSWSSATRDRAAVPACRRCSIRPAT